MTRVKNFKIAEDSAKYVAYLLEAPLGKEADKDKTEKKKKPKAVNEEKKEAGQKPTEKQDEKKAEKKKSRERNSSFATWRWETVSVQEVSEYTWSKDGRFLAYATSSKSQKMMELFSMNQPLIKPLSCLKARATM